jgi:hypothetical protein
MLENIVQRSEPVSIVVRREVIVAEAAPEV